jgi:hypothetical protein
MKRQISWGVLLWAAFLILVITDWRNLKYLSNLIKELSKLIKNNSKYTEDNCFILINKNQLKNL